MRNNKNKSTIFLLVIVISIFIVSGCSKQNVSEKEHNKLLEENEKLISQLSLAQENVNTKVTGSFVAVVRQLSRTNITIYGNSLFSGLPYFLTSIFISCFFSDIFTLQKNFLQIKHFPFLIPSCPYHKIFYFPCILICLVFINCKSFANIKLNGSVVLFIDT